MFVCVLASYSAETTENFCLENLTYKKFLIYNIVTLLLLTLCILEF
jgi:hypothetical protein